MEFCEVFIYTSILNFHFLKYLYLVKIQNILMRFSFFIYCFFKNCFKNQYSQSLESKTWEAVSVAATQVLSLRQCNSSSRNAQGFRVVSRVSRYCHFPTVGYQGLQTGDPTGIFSVFKRLTQGCEKIKPDSSWRCPWKDKQNWAWTDTKESLSKAILVARRALNCCSHGLQNLHVRDIQNMVRTWSLGNLLNVALLERGFGFPEVPSSPSYSVILWHLWSYLKLQSMMCLRVLHKNRK